MPIPFMKSSGSPSREVPRNVIASRLLYLSSIVCLKSDRNITFLTFTENVVILKLNVFFLITSIRIMAVFHLLLSSPKLKELFPPKT